VEIFWQDSYVGYNIIDDPQTKWNDRDFTLIGFHGRERSRWIYTGNCGELIAELRSSELPPIDRVNGIRNFRVPEVPAEDSTSRDID